MDSFDFRQEVPQAFPVLNEKQIAVKRVASAVGEGAMAVQFVHEYLKELRSGTSAKRVNAI
jgi:thioredoxin reductase (NADPH)